MTINEFKKFCFKELNFSPTPELDCNVLLEHFLNLSKTQILLNHQTKIPNDKLELLLNSIKKRKNGLPISYITNSREFYGFNFYVTPDVLIPKADTEILVEKAIQSIEQNIRQHQKQLTICDMCTGSGCIGLSVLLTLFNIINSSELLPNFIFVDISESALEIAKKNTRNLLEKKQDLLKKIKFVKSDLFSKITEKFDFILTNPPYIPKKMVDELLKDGRSEPRLALDGDLNESNDGLSIIRRLIIQSKNHLNNFGEIFMETGEYNALQTEQFAQQNNFITKIYKDLEGQLRVVWMKNNLGF